MSYGSKSWIAEYLVEDPDELKRVVMVKSETHWYGSTVGPWMGMGGSAMTEFTMTLIVFPSYSVIYADDRRMGKVKPEFREAVMENFPRVTALHVDLET